MNKVILIGRLTREPDIRYAQNDASTEIARYTLAVDRRFKRSNSDATADFIPCVAFGRSAEFAEKFLHKGMKIAVTGRIQTGSYTNREGNKVYTTDVIVEDQEFVESKAASQNSGSNYSNDARNTAAQQPAQQPAQSSSYGANDPGEPVDEGFINIPEGIEEELPFS